MALMSATIDTPEPQRVLVYGPSKSGKTRAVAALAEKFTLHVIDCEFGWEVAKQLPAEWLTRINRISIADNATTPEAGVAVFSLMRGEKFSVCSKHNKFRCALCKEQDVLTLEMLKKPNTILVIDSLPQLSNSIINNLVRMKSNGTMEYQMQIQDWGKCNAIMDMILSYLQSARINVVCISLEKDIAPMDAPEKLAPTIMTKEFGRTSAKYFDAAVFAEFSNLKYRLITKQATKTNAPIGARKANDVDATNSLLSLFHYDEVGDKI